MADQKISQLPSAGTVTQDDLFIINNGATGNQSTSSISVTKLQELFGGQGSTKTPQIIDLLDEGNRWEKSFTSTWGNSENGGDPVTLGTATATVDIKDAPAALVAWSTVSGTRILPELVAVTKSTNDHNFPWMGRAEFVNSITLEGGSWSSKTDTDTLAINTKLVLTVRPNNEANFSSAKFQQRIPQHKIAMIKNTGDGVLKFTIQATVDKAGFSAPFTFPGRIFVLPIDTIPEEVATTFSGGEEVDFYDSSVYPTLADYAKTVSDPDTEEEIRAFNLARLENSIEVVVSRLNHTIQYHEANSANTTLIENIKTTRNKFLNLRDTTSFAQLESNFNTAMQEVINNNYLPTYPES